MKRYNARFFEGSEYDVAWDFIEGDHEHEVYLEFADGEILNMYMGNSYDEAEKIFEKEKENGS